MKQTIKLRETELKRIIAESVKRAINEGTTSDDIFEKWELLKEQVGCEQMVNDIFNYLSSDQLEQLIEWFDQDYDLFDQDDDEW